MCRCARNRLKIITLLSINFSAYTTHVKSCTYYFFHLIDNRKQTTLGRNTCYPILPSRFIRMSECSFRTIRVISMCILYLKHVLLLELQGWPVLCKSWLLQIRLPFQRARFSIGTWWYCRFQGEHKEQMRGRKVTVLQVCRTFRFSVTLYGNGTIFIVKTLLSEVCRSFRPSRPRSDCYELPLNSSYQILSASTLCLFWNDHSWLIKIFRIISYGFYDFISRSNISSI